MTGRIVTEVPIQELEALMGSIRSDQEPDDNGLVKLVFYIDDDFIQLSTKHLSDSGRYATADCHVE